ncbi:MAG: glycosyltransferase family 4 protein [Steroidobacteraceae bacterium]
MTLCYLINQYPKVSHSFIRREIVELENQGAQVLRIALRGWEQPLVDPRDLAEQRKTRYVLKQGAAPVLGWLCRQFFRSPARFVRVLSNAFLLSRQSDQPLIKHMICFAEACVAAGWARAGNASHIHAHFGTNSAEVAMLASLLSDIPYSFTVHGPEEFDHPEGLCLRTKMHHAACIVAISSFGRSQLFRWAAPQDWNRIAVVHCGLDDAFLGGEAAGVSASNVFVCVGRLSEQKGQLLLLEALRRVLDRGIDCRLVLAGDGELRALIEQRAKELKVTNHLTITGWIGGDEVKQEILAARALVLPSFAEGLPVVLMEAMALARPVITTSVAGIPELVKDGECGWLVPAGDVESLAQAMVDCLACHDDKLTRMGQNGRGRVQERHDIRTEAARLLGLFGKGAA